MMSVAFSSVLMLFANVCSLQSSEGPEAYRRPAFDKSPYAKTVWSQANPWFPPNLSRTHHTPGGPDSSWWTLSSDARIMWRQVAEKMAPYGLTGLQMEITMLDDGRLGWAEVFRSMLEGFEDARVEFFGVPFFSRPAADVASTVKALEELMPLIREHPNVYRLDGKPVLVLYTPTGLEPVQWVEVIETLEARHGRMVWLFNTWMESLKDDMQKVRDYLRVFDGITQYANWGSGRKHFESLAEVREDFPEKIWELAVHHTYFVHFHYGGVDPILTRKYRREWAEIFDFEPDAVTITNFFDKYENSRVFPSYEAEDILMRIAHYHITRWRGEQDGLVVDRRDVPDLYVSNLTSGLLGQPLRFEVIGFPMENEPEEVAVYLELCDENGNVLHAFPRRVMDLGEKRVEEYEIASEEFYDRRAVLPRLRCTWRGQERTSYLFPHTNVVTSMRPHFLYWARSVRRMIHASEPWGIEVEGKGPGETVLLPETGLGLIRGRGTSGITRTPAPVHQGGGHVRILRNGREQEAFERWDLRFEKPLMFPSPGQALDWYNLELENPRGGRYLTPPVWLVSGERRGQVSLPVLLETGELKEFDVEAVRVPFFNYPCDRDTGTLLLDTSGYQHHGYLGGRGYGGGHLGYTGYRHEHKPLTGVPPMPEDIQRAGIPEFRRDEKGNGYLHFNGESFAMIMGGTAFPYASTYELSLKPEQVGQRQGILGAPNLSVRIWITEEGNVEVARTGMLTGRPQDVRLRSPGAIAVGRWTHVAVTYDLREMRLFVDGELSGTAAIEPLRAHEQMNPVVIGGTSEFPYTPKPSFVGGIRNLRFYGRNLKPEEFLIR